MKKGLCECGCGAKTTISNRTRESKGHVKGQPMRFIIGHVHRGKKPALERRIKTSRTLTGREPVLSPYVPGLLITFDTQKKRWCASGVLHARAVWEYYNGSVPKGFRVHHKSGHADTVEQDHIDNLMLVTNEWNIVFMPGFARCFNISEREVTQAYLQIENLPYAVRFAAVRKILLDKIKGERI